jgi:hypothetical protein
MTSEEIILNAAMERAGGNAGLAATLMGMTPAEVNKALRGCEELRLRWMQSNQTDPPPRQAETVHRPPVQLPEPNGFEPPEVDYQPTRDEVALVESIVKEDELLQFGLERLGLTPKEAAIALELQKFHEGHFVKSIQILGAGMTATCIKMMTQLAEVKDRIDEVRELQKKAGKDQDRSALVDEETNMLRIYIQLGQTVRSMFQTAQHGAMLQAIAMYRKSGRGNTLKSANKPGFQPLSEFTEAMGHQNGDRKK